MKLLKKYTIMFVPFNQKKVISFDVTNVGLIFISSIIFLLISLTVLSFVSDSNIFKLKDNQIRNTYIKDTVSIFNDKFEKSRKNYYALKKDIEKFILYYYPVFYQRFNISSRIALLDEVNFLIKVLVQFSGFYSNLNNFFAHVPSIFPVVGGGKVTSGFGPRMDPFTMSLSYHTGVDIPKFPGTPIRSTAKGKVILANWNPSYGFIVKIQHDYGFVTLYAHMISFPLVKEGDDVRQGQIIGNVGSTGRSVGYHLHYEVRNSGKLLDPVNYLFLKR